MGTDPRRRNLSPPPLSARETGTMQSSERLSKPTGAEPRRCANPCKTSYVQHTREIAIGQPHINTKMY